MVSPSFEKQGTFFPIFEKNIYLKNTIA